MICYQPNVTSAEKPRLFRLKSVEGKTINQIEATNLLKCINFLKKMSVVYHPDISAQHIVRMIDDGWSRAKRIALWHTSLFGPVSFSINSNLKSFNQKKFIEKNISDQTASHFNDLNDGHDDYGHANDFRFVGFFLLNLRFDLKMFIGRFYNIPLPNSSERMEIRKTVQRKSVSISYRRSRHTIYLF